MALARLAQPSASTGNRAVLYLRQSKEREDSESIETQEYLGRQYCRERGYDVVDVKVDVLSGRKWDTRPGVVATMQLVEESRADVIVLWKWSRLSRNRLHWALASDRVALAGGRIESVTEPIDTSTASGRFARGVMTEYAAFQSESMGEVWNDALARRVARGLLPSNGDRYGYERDGDNYRPHPVEGPLLAEAYERYVNGSGIMSIARWLNEAGHRTKRGKQFAQRTLSATFESGFAAGLVRWQGAYHPGVHEAIISQETWEAYLAKKASQVPPPRGRRRMASGLLRCLCGHRMYLGASSKAQEKHTADYKCGTAQRGLVKCAQPMNVKLHLVEQYLTDWVETLAAKPDSLRRAAEKETAQRVRSIENRGAIERRIAAVTTKLSDLALLLVDGKISQAAYDASSGRLDDELASLRKRHVRTVPTPKRDLLEVIPVLTAGFDELTPEGQNLVLKQLIHHVDITPSLGRRTGIWRERFHVVPLWEYADEGTPYADDE